MTQSYRLKIIFIGDPDVGKTSLIKNFVEGVFPRDYLPTIGTNFYIKNIAFSSKNEEYDCQLSIWDVAGQDLWSGMRMQYYKSTDGVFLVGDLTRSQTFEHLVSYWKKDMGEFVDLSKPRLLLANKADLTTNYKKNQQFYNTMAKSLDCRSYFLTSAKTGLQVQDGFVEMVKACLNIQDLNPSNKKITKS
jgi:small GTP-binding protein